MNSSIIYTSGLYCVVDRRWPGDISPAPCDLRRDRYIAVFQWPFGARVHVKSRCEIIKHSCPLRIAGIAFSTILKAFNVKLRSEYIVGAKRSCEFVTNTAHDRYASTPLKACLSESDRRLHIHAPPAGLLQSYFSGLQNA